MRPSRLTAVHFGNWVPLYINVISLFCLQTVKCLATYHVRAVGRVMKFPRVLTPRSSVYHVKGIPNVRLFSAQNGHTSYIHVMAALILMSNRYRFDKLLRYGDWRKEKFTVPTGKASLSLNIPVLLIKLYRFYVALITTHTLITVY